MGSAERERMNRCECVCLCVRRKVVFEFILFNLTTEKPPESISNAHIVFPKNKSTFSHLILTHSTEVRKKVSSRITLKH